MLATVFLSAGTPMLLAGDEFGRTQHGNNNAYCQDNEMSWLDWRMATSPDGAALTDYVARLIALRREHPVLRCPVFLHGKEQPAPGIADIAWFDEHGGTISAEAWNDREQRTLILRRATNDTDGKVTILTLLLNPTDRAQAVSAAAAAFAGARAARQCGRHDRRILDRWRRSVSCRT